MRRLSAVLASCAGALSMANVAGGCDSFEEGTETTTDAASESIAPPPSDDGGPTTDANDGGNTAGFCARNPQGLFCDDFEQPGRDLAVADPWTSSTTSGPQARTLGLGNMSLHGLNVKGLIVEGNETRLSTLFPVVAQKTRISMDVKIDKLTKNELVGGIPHFGVAALLFSNGREMVLFLNASATNQISGFVYSRFTDAGGTNDDFVTSAVPPLVGGGFFRLAIEFEPNGTGEDQFRFYLGAAPSPVLMLNVNPPAGDSAIAVRARGSGIPSDVDVTIDNVLVESF